MDIVIVTVNENRKGFNVESITGREKYINWRLNGCKVKSCDEGF